MSFCVFLMRSHWVYSFSVLVAPTKRVDVCEQSAVNADIDADVRTRSTSGS